MSEEREDLGRAVEGGAMRYTSPSALSKGNPADNGCLRRWWFRYVDRKAEPQHASAALGTKGHAEIERFLTTGERALGQIAMRASHAIPAPGPDLLVEHSISGKPALSKPVLWVAGNVPMHGKIDVVNFRGTNAGGSDFGDTIDPPGTVEILDWKFTGSMQFAKAPHELPKQIPMVSYGEAVARQFQGVEFVRLSHVYVPTKTVGPAKKSTIRIDRARLAREWETIDPIARVLADVAKAPNANMVDANLRACGAYGGCPHRSYCSAGMHNSLESMFGATAAASMIANLSPNTNKETPQMSNPLASILALTGQPAPAQPQPFANPSGVGVEMGAHLATLANEQAAAQARAGGTHPAGSSMLAGLPGYMVAAPPMPHNPPMQVAPTPNVPAAPPPPAPAPQMEFARFVEACKFIDAVNQGWPALAGEAAQLKCAMQGIPISPGAGLAPSGKLAGLPQITDPRAVIKLAEDLRPYAPPGVALGGGAPAPAPVSPHLPPDAPPSNPATAAAPVPGYGAPAPTAPAPVQAPAPAAAPAEGKRKPGRPRKNAAAQPAAPTTGAMGQMVPNNTAAAPDDAELEVFVDCIPSAEFESLRDYVDGICNTLAKHYGCADIRIAPKDSPLGYGGWRGAVTAFIRERPPEPGCYVLDTRGSEIAECVADALAGRKADGSKICDLYVRGVR